MPFFSENGLYLAGGTALALQVGHRESVDLDFFTPERLFDEKKAEEALGQTGKWRTSSLSRATLYGTFLSAKVSLIGYPFFKPVEPLLQKGTISIVTPPDIAAMKIVAVSQRGRKRDFIDLYWLGKHIQSLGESVVRAQKQYAVPQNPTHLLKSLVYFDDAEADPMPTLLFKASWEEVKAYFRHEVPRIAKELMGLH